MARTNGAVEPQWKTARAASHLCVYAFATGGRHSFQGHIQSAMTTHAISTQQVAAASRSSAVSLMIQPEQSPPRRQPF